MHPSVEKYAEHVNPAFVKLLGTFGYGRVFVKAKGTRLVDNEGREYLDFLAGFGATSLGHNPPRLLEKMREMLSDDAPNVMHVGPQVHAAELAEALARRTAPLTMALVSCSGGEAVESALKVARAATGRQSIVYCRGGWHGTGMGSLSIMGWGRMRDPFEPLVPACYEIPYGDLPALEKELGQGRVAAFVVEPLQAEAGVIVPDQGYLAGARDLCKKHGALLVLDEVQTGLGRTGTLFAYQGASITPDVLVLGKALGGGMVPISAAMTTREIFTRAYGTVDKFDLHGSTYSGNAFACRTALETLRIIDDEGLVGNAVARGSQLMTRLRNSLGRHPLVRDVRGQGLLVGLELGATDKGLLNRLLPGMVDAVSKRVFGQWLAVRLLERGVLCQPASQQWNVLKLEPPLTVTAEEIERVAVAIEELLADYTDVARVLRDAGERLGTQLIGKWSFR